MLDIIIVRTKFVAISAKYLIRASALVNEVKLHGVNSCLCIPTYLLYIRIMYVRSSRILGFTLVGTHK